ncbi:unnamed protein product [Spirodela intermedia]|uniref:Uncharacterized protein n=1 Tax=Spirodela intermedia TaxID=51605 RepID=A0A7I8IGF3_SPIIN|nr:unnamed protein product [Spirodela intermedia]CAA6656948.1 unnamed protein product [Spirodela intermedia]
MLPWLVIPFIVLWALSQLFSPDLRFEITSPRLACVVVLLGTIFWYEILLPHLSVYRARRCARIREQQLSFAIELQKLRKTATRRCRNCLTPYRDQKPGGGKFMCSYCGHVSKRPILDIPGPPGSSGILSNLIRKSGWFFNLDCPALGRGNWDGHVNPAPRHWVNGGHEQSSEEETCSRAAIFIWKLLSSVFYLTRQFYRRFLKFGSPVEDGSLDTEHEGSSKEGEHVCQESKGEKARRKAEERRLARLEKEMLEEEERNKGKKDIKVEAEKESLKPLALDGSRDGRKEESDKRRRDRKKEKDKNSSKSNSDGEDHDSRGKKETEKKREFARKNDNERQELCRIQRVNAEVVSSVMGVANKSKSFDRMKGTSLFSSRGTNGWTLFGKNSHAASVLASKSNKPVVGSADKVQWKESCSVAPDLNQPSIPKKSWHQLFTRPLALSSSSDENFGKKLDGIPEAKISDSADHKLPSHPSLNQMQCEQSLACTNDPSANGALASDSSSLTIYKSRVPLAGELGHNFGTEEAELFQDPCFVPDPTSLIGPVSESLDDFLSDPGLDFKDDLLSDPSQILRRVCDSSDVKKPSPIESPMSRLWMSRERHIGSGSCSPRSQDQSALPDNEYNNVSEQGTWQMWSSSLCKDGLDLVGGPASWLSALEQNRVTPDIITRPPAENPIATLGVMEKNILRSTFKHSDNVCIRNPGDDGMVSPFTANDPWSSRCTLFQDPWFSPLHSFPGDGENHFPHPRFHGGVAQEETFGSPNIYASGLPLDQSQAYYCPG